MEDKKMSFRAKEQLLASASSICANLAEMGAFESKAQMRQKPITCIGEANETEFWLDLCNSLKVIP
ncbi:MAG: four helix bundle protein [Candidatus Bilamarchaeaceae archaeon]